MQIFELRFGIRFLIGLMAMICAMPKVWKCPIVPVLGTGLYLVPLPCLQRSGVTGKDSVKLVGGTGFEPVTPAV